MQANNVALPFVFSGKKRNKNIMHRSEKPMGTFPKYSHKYVLFDFAMILAVFAQMTKYNSFYHQCMKSHCCLVDWSSSCVTGPTSKNLSQSAFFTSKNLERASLAASTSSGEATATTTPLSLTSSTTSANSLKSCNLQKSKKVDKQQKKYIATLYHYNKLKQELFSSLLRNV